MSTEFVLDILIPEQQLRQFYGRVREDFLSYFDNTETLQDQASRCNNTWMLQPAVRGVRLVSFGDYLQSPVAGQNV